MKVKEVWGMFEITYNPNEFTPTMDIFLKL